MLSFQDEDRKRKFELALMESELASMEDRSVSPGHAAHTLALLKKFNRGRQSASRK